MSFANMQILYMRCSKNDLCNMCPQYSMTILYQSIASFFDTAHGTRILPTVGTVCRSSLTHAWTCGTRGGVGQQTWHWDACPLNKRSNENINYILTPLESHISSTSQIYKIRSFGPIVPLLSNQVRFFWLTIKASPACSRTLQRWYMEKQIGLWDMWNAIFPTCSDIF